MKWRRNLPLLSLAVVLAGYYWLADVRLHKLLWYGAFAVNLVALWPYRTQVRTVLSSPILWAIFGYMMYQLLSLSWSEIASTEEYGELLRKSAFTLAFVGIVAAAFRDELSTKRVVLFTVFMAATSSALAVGQWVMLEQTAIRLSGLGRMLNPIQAGCLYGVALLLSGWAVAHYWSRSKWLAALLGGGWFVLLLALLATQSRGAWLGAVVAHGILLLFSPAVKCWHRVTLALLAGLAVVASSFWVDWATIVARADGFRFFVWQHVLDGWQVSPVFGRGYRHPFELMLPYGDIIYQPHSIYMGALYYGGVVGLAALLLLFGSVGWQIRQRRAIHGATLWLALLANAAIIGIVDYDVLIVNLGVEWIVFWLPIAGALSIAMQTGYQPKDMNAYSA